MKGNELLRRCGQVETEGVEVALHAGLCLFSMARGQVAVLGVANLGLISDCIEGDGDFVELRRWISERKFLW